jgi:3-dehydroquinate dehydratase-1
MKKYQADIMKFATFVQDDADSKILFQFLFDKQDSEEMIVVGMGEKGKMIRVAGPLFGSYLTYASTDYSQSAPGQIDVSRLKKLYNEFREI